MATDSHSNARSVFRGLCQLVSTDSSPSLEPVLDIEKRHSQFSFEIGLNSPSGLRRHAQRQSTLLSLGLRALVTVLLSILSAPMAKANPTNLTAWQTKYPASTSDTLAQTKWGNICFLCHMPTTPPDDPISSTNMNPYGTRLKALGSTVPIANRLDTIKDENSDGDADTSVSNHPCTNIKEINGNTLPGDNTSTPGDCGQPPIGVSDKNYNTTFQTILNVAASQGVLVGVTDPDGDSFTAIKKSGPTPDAGILHLNDDGSFNYTPPTLFSGDVTFTYAAKDITNAESSTKQVTVNVGQACAFNPDTTAHDFGSIKLGVSSALDITITNDGTRDCRIDVNLSSTTGELSLATGPTITVAASRTGTVSVNYVPVDEIADNGILNLVSKDMSNPANPEPDNPQDVPITLSGVGYDPPTIVVMDRVETSTGYVTDAPPDATAGDNQDGTVSTRVVDVTPVGETPSVMNIEGPYRPGRYILTYEATDTDGNTSTQTQQLDILPLVRLGVSQITGEGRTISVPIIMNGNAPEYPVSIQYAVSGTATSSDYAPLSGTLDITSGTEGVLNIDILTDSIAEPDEQLVITLTGVGPNAKLSSDVSHTVAITESNVAPSVEIDISQADTSGPDLPSITGPYVYTNLSTELGGVTITANATDPNGDSLTYDWSSTDAALGATTASARSFTIAPAMLAALAPGNYQIAVSVSDGVNQVSNTATLVVSTEPPLLSATQDTDGDGTDDATEGRSDHDGDGIPDYLDPVDDSILQNGHVLNSSGNNFFRLMTTTPGLRLVIGQFAIEALTPPQPDAPIKVGAAIFPDDLPSDPGFNFVSGVYDFEIRGLSAAQRAGQVVIPLTSAISENVTYRKFAKNVWDDFIETATDGIRSARSDETTGECPPPGDAAYENGLIPFMDCLELTLTDGGPNDADGEANGVIKDPGGVAVPASASSDSTTSTADNSSPGGAGALGWEWLILLAPLPWLHHRHKQGQKNA